jgi:hypothetical protein
MYWEEALASLVGHETILIAPYFLHREVLIDSTLKWDTSDWRHNVWALQVGNTPSKS